MSTNSYFRKLDGTYIECASYAKQGSDVCSFVLLITPPPSDVEVRSAGVMCKPQIKVRAMHVNSLPLAVHLAKTTGTTSFESFSSFSLLHLNKHLTF